jgi:predicted nuclease with TOPRIM domain
MEKLIFIGPASKLALIRTRFRSLQGVTISQEETIQAAEETVPGISDDELEQLHTEISELIDSKAVLVDELEKANLKIQEYAAATQASLEEKGKMTQEIQDLQSEIDRLNALDPEPAENIAVPEKKSTKANKKK